MAKLELANPGGSMKDRPALQMLEGALRRNDIRLSTTVIESTSGNMGIGLAQACRRLGLSLICVVDVNTNRANIRLMETLGANVEIVDKPLGSGLLEARISRVRELLHTIPDSYWPNQYENPDNALAHQQTMREIAEVLDGQVHTLFCSTGTCGTIRGCLDYVRTNELPTNIVAVDAAGSVLFGGTAGPRLIPGHGSSRPAHDFNTEAVDDVVTVSDEDCVRGCHHLLSTEAILAGGSSGGVIQAVRGYVQRIPPGANIVVILADRGERYLDTIFSTPWLQQHGFDVPMMKDGNEYSR
ncbi:2,3-diaminopropionate biosynthesis protein SbnA [Nocardia sputorum]|nr:2,3-diaminopropionate biosynthesis protein SbnA [Nocardia sputorum]